MKGKLIVIEGTDGSGKGTQTKRLFDKLSAEGYNVEMIDFPRYREPGAVMVEEYLNGHLGTLDEIGPYPASVLYAVDRYYHSRKMHKWLSEGKVILCNRYMTANKGHQAGKIKDLSERDEYLAWLDDLEFEKFKIPRPDKVFLLFMPCEIAQRLVGQKDMREYLGGKKMDIHESSLQHLKDAEAAYLYVAKKEGWSIIECGDGDKPLPIETIFSMIYEQVKKML
ncbi:thymidylate kinase [Candidatus Woesearchaeota archaeon]|nr:thymidylate kinase [Candidatus Woesearchaeota archaeon]